MKMASGIRKEKVYKNLPMKVEEEVQEPSTVQDKDHHEQEDQPQSPLTSVGSSSSTPNLTPVRIRNLIEIYATCNFYVVEWKCFEQEAREEVIETNVTYETQLHMPIE